MLIIVARWQVRCKLKGKGAIDGDRNSLSDKISDERVQMSSTVPIEKTYFTRRHIQEVTVCRGHCHENLKSSISNLFLVSYLFKFSSLFFPYFSFLFTERPGVLVSSPASYLGGPRFKSQL
jgi:hypothetical protein